MIGTLYLVSANPAIANPAMIARDQDGVLQSRFNAAVVHRNIKAVELSEVAYTP